MPESKSSHCSAALYCIMPFYFATVIGKCNSMFQIPARRYFVVATPLQQICRIAVSRSPKSIEFCALIGFWIHIWNIQNCLHRAVASRFRWLSTRCYNGANPLFIHILSREISHFKQIGIQINQNQCNVFGNWKYLKYFRGKSGLQTKIVCFHHFDTIRVICSSSNRFLVYSQTSFICA